MIKTIPFIIALFLAVSIQAQKTIPNPLKIKFEAILDNPKILSEYDLTKKPALKQLVLPMDFANSQLESAFARRVLKDANILHVAYAYSEYSQSVDFDQHKLNQLRLLNLHTALPQLFNQEEMTWQSNKQTAAKNAVDAEKLFHGFVIYFRQKPTKKSMAAEEKYIIKVLEELETPHIAHRDLSGTSDTHIAFVAEEEAESTEIVHVLDESLTFVSSEAIFSKLNHFNLNRDTTIFAVFNRNLHWDKMLINCDLTGSMSPYSAQLFAWHKLNFDKEKIQHFVFFNDGNSTPDAKKKVGNTGGIYHTPASSFKQMKRIALQCMKAGGGGDAPENDIEALLKGFNKCPDCGDVILIADNWANMRDYKLLHQIDRPVRVILCGSSFGINTQYLDLARATNGSVHTIEEDIDSLMDLKEGEIIEISDQTFRITNGHFVHINKKNLKRKGSVDL